MYDRAPRDASLKMRPYLVPHSLWRVVAAQLTGRTISSVSRSVSIGSKSGTGD
jgi:hypothetical protein